MSKSNAKRYDKYVAHFPSALLKVDECLTESVGMDRRCLADAPYYAWWQDGMTPAEMAQEALTNEFGDRAPKIKGA
jgi:hypothetical protein